ncbi:ABC transporter permease [Actinomadura parmotrematis]|uniref:Transport permease protein n=1 Tax=Actinomadura parmotrematis TaxID=2864039 RepID=A0ABS7G260_9ACTN|nr:ABC transporter permease [Actinomadura parmotrematis]MBW8486794.1 ABC transporter permease [Actinomadura parmotrematis]
MLRTIIVSETRLRLREGLTPALAVALPLALLLTFGLLPHAASPSADLGGQTSREYIAALATAVAFAVLALTMLPGVLSDYREKGVLRRLHATPVRPTALLVAELAVMAGASLVSLALMVGGGRIMLGTALPRAGGWFALAAALCLLSMLALGTLISAVAPSGRAGNALGVLAFFPSMFLAGVYTPYDTMPHGLQRVCDWTPLCAGLRAMRAAWSGHAPTAMELAIMTGYGLVATIAAAKLFRWE